MMSRAYELMEGVDAEVSLEAGLSTVLKDQTFSDVTLVANDGIKVPAHRVILCARSKVFKTMLTGSFSENSSPTIEVDFPGAVVNAVVEHIYTNEVKLLKTAPAKVDEFQVLVSLTAAAAYYNLPTLCQRVNSCMQDCVMRMPSLSFAVMEACAQEGPAISKDVFQAALSIIYQKLDVERSSESLNEDVLCSLSSSVLGQVLRDEDPPFLLQEFTRFQMVQRWSKNEADRQEAAKAMVKEHIKLHWIKPEELADSVAPSGLTDIVQLAEAYRVQAVNAKYRLPFGKYLSHPIWCESNSDTCSPRQPNEGSWKTDKLKYCRLLDGHKYQWIITADTLGGAESSDGNNAASGTSPAPFGTAAPAFGASPPFGGPVNNSPFGSPPPTGGFGSTSPPPFGAPAPGFGGSGGRGRGGRGRGGRGINRGQNRNGVVVGVAKSSATLDICKNCGEQPSCFGMGGVSGHIYRDGLANTGGMCLGSGQHKLHFTLDLSPEEVNNGRLSISVDDGVPLTVADGLKGSLLFDVEGFVPVVSCYAQSSATIVCFMEAL